MNSLNMKKVEGKKLGDMEMIYLSSMCCLTQIDKVRNDELSRSISMREELSDIKWVESICSGLNMWGVWVGADDWYSVCVCRMWTLEGL